MQIEKTLEKMRTCKANLLIRMETPQNGSERFFGTGKSEKLAKDIKKINMGIKALEKYRNDIQNFLNMYSANEKYWNAHMDAFENMLANIESKDPTIHKFSPKDFKLDAPEIDYVLTGIDTYENVLLFTAKGAQFGAVIGVAVAATLLVIAASISTGPLLPLTFTAMIGALILITLGLAVAAGIGALLGTPLGAGIGLCFNQPNSGYNEDLNIENCEMLRSIKDAYGVLFSDPSLNLTNDESLKLAS